VDQIKSQLDALAEMNDEQLSELQSTIVSEFEMVEGEDPTPETVDAMTSLADALDTVRGELSRREAQAEELAAKAAEATARVKGVEETEQDGEAMADITEEEVIPTEEAPVEEAPVEETPAEEAPADNTPAEVADQVEEGTAEAEAEETPVDEEAEAKKKKAFSTDETVTETETETEAAAEAEVVVEETTSTIDGEGIELSTEEETVADAAEFSAEETVDVAEAAAEVVAEVEAPVAEAEVAVEAVAEAVEGSEASTLETSTEIAPEAQEEQATVTASADESFAAPADRQPVIQVSEASPVAITAGADIPGYTAGSTINDMNEVASAMEKRIHSLRRVNGGDGEQHIVASITTTFDEARTLTTDAEANSAKISAFAADSALVASGGHGAPYEVKYDIFGLGSTTVRPVRDSLPKFQADRGGIRYVTPPSFAGGAYADAVGIWTAAVDADPQSATKASLTVAAAAEQTATTDAVTLQLQFGNLMTRAYPELIARHNELALVQHAREAEQNLLTKIGDASTAVTTSSLIGFGRDFLVQIRRAAVAYRSRHRIDAGTQLKAIVPDWVIDAMAVDLTLSMPGDGTIALSKSEIEGYLANSNVTLVASPDQNAFGAQGAAALLEFPDSFSWYLFAEGTFLFLDGGTLDLGIIRDSTLVGTNDYKMFVETFEGLAKVGIESLKITSSISINGVAAALRDTTGGATAAAIEL
jgi:chemotaxis protein histidine kinase CheA